MLIAVCLLLPAHDVYLDARGQLVPAPAAVGAVPAPPVPDAEPPATLANSNAIAWTSEVPISGSVSLAVGETMVVAIGTAEPLRGWKLTDGSLAWESTMTSGLQPVTDGASFYIAADERLCALAEATGQTRWCTVTGPITIAPSVHAGIVLVATATALTAYAAADGAGLWTQDLAAPAATSVAVDRAQALVGLADGTLASFQFPSGALQWRRDLGFVAGPMTLADDRIYLGTSDRSICALKRTSGSQDWCFAVRVPTSGPPAIDGPNVYFPLLDNTVRVLDRRSGAMKRREALKGRPSGGLVQFGERLTVPLISGELWLLDPAGASRVLPAPHAEESSRALEASGVSVDGTTFVTLTVSPGLSRLLAAYRAAPRSSPPQ